jgi:DUF1009 family protein
MDGLGIIAGGGDLPIAVAESATRAGRPVFVMGLKGAADDGISRFTHDWVAMGESRKALDLLHAHGCKDVILCGKVSRPRFADVKLDAKSVLLLPKVLAAARKGDDALLRAVVDIFEKEGFRTVGIAEAAPGLLAREGSYGRVSPNAADVEDIAHGVKVVRRLGALDVGQAAAVCGGLVLAVEAAEGTDAMIARVATLPERIRGTPSSREGVLVKALKPVQDRKTDLPVIGVQTVRNVAAAGLRGIAIEAGNALVINETAVVEAADAAGIFVTGFDPAAHAG